MFCTFARRIAALKGDNYPQAFGLDPLLEMAKLYLQLAQLGLIGLALHFFLAGIRFCQFRSLDFNDRAEKPQAL